MRQARALGCGGAGTHRMQLGEFSGPAGRVLRRSESTPYQLTIFKALGVPPPPQFHLAETPAQSGT